MIPDLPSWINILFLFACVICLVFFYLDNNKSIRLLALAIGISLVHSTLAYSGYYLNTEASPPRFALVLIPSTLFILYGLIFRRELRRKNQSQRIYGILLHSVRLPIEIVLFGLYLNQMVPELMTFAGRNYDILMGISAPLIGLLYWKKLISKKLLVIWNFTGLILVTFILINGILSAELPFQQFAFDQPNRGISYFPFVLLPALIVPIVIWTHLLDLIALLDKNKN